ncbi:MAG: DNA topoisomerase 3 [Defluviitaleaceae bacterium]|nr:DNA topoisomerase 3 [Defluviitaleaceae bacterium]
MSKHSVIIAEKPSVARSIGTVLGAKTKKDGYYEGNGYIVSWCIGHLLGLAPPEAYDEKYAKWRIADLPILPETYQYTPNDATKKQLVVLKGLLNRADVSEVINACDAGREGELIFRLVYEHCKCKKPLKRLWISSLEESAIADGFKNLRAGRDYDNLHQAAVCRQNADWAVGMNCSRLFSCLYNGNLSIGRVQTPTLAMIVARELKIKNFVKEPFYIVEISGEGLVAAREKLTDATLAEQIRQKCDGQIATIKSVTREKKTSAPQKLYDLTTLQREANRHFGCTAADTLKAAQNLYEQKLITYPRTDSRFITEDMAAGIPALVNMSAEILPFDAPVSDGLNERIRAVVKNAGVTDHHAIIPTPTANTVNIASLPAPERNILLMVCTRLVSATAEKHVYDETVITVECQDELFTAKGKTVVTDGWKAVERAFSQSCGKKKAEKDDETTLPSMTEGQQFTAAATTREGFTSPPPHFTEDLLLKAMETAGKDDMPDDVGCIGEQDAQRPTSPERKGIGTPATRADCIEKLILRAYITRDGKKILPTEKGFGLIAVLPDDDPIKKPLLTAEWEQKLKKVESGETDAAAFMQSTEAYVRAFIAANSTAKAGGAALASPASASAAKEEIGKCPWCSGNVYENKAAFSCDGDCSFVLWKENKYYAPLKNKKLTAANAKALITKGKVLMKDLLAKDGKKTYDAFIVLGDSTDDNGKRTTKFQLEFPQK